MKNINALFKRFARWPLGKWTFSRFVCLLAPYFSTIKPQIQSIDHGVCITTMKQRRKVQNHIKTVHAIAVCNLCELSMGMAIESAIPNKLRWIPKGMSVQYLKKAKGTLTATCDISKLDIQPGALDIPVVVTDTANNEVVTAVITLHITEKQGAT